jgi:hypothetical protein
MNKIEKYKQAELEKRVKAELDPIDIDQRYRDLLDEIYPEVKIGDSRYSPSRIVEELSPTDFRCGKVDWIDSEIRDGIISEEIDGEYYDQREVSVLELEIEGGIDTREVIN